MTKATKEVLEKKLRENLKRRKEQKIAVKNNENNANEVNNSEIKKNI